MSTGSDRVAASGKPGSRTQVEDDSGRRPFMRGIIVHSLLSRGVGFDEAYRAANAVRDQVRSRAVVSREELAKLVGDAVGAASLRESPREPRWPTPILVTRRKGQGAPFSKGFLSQSLLAAAIEPNDAFDVARDIERQLVQRGCEEVQRHDLRRLAYEALHARLGPRAAERHTR